MGLKTASKAQCMSKRLLEKSAVARDKCSESQHDFERPEVSGNQAMRMLCGIEDSANSG